MTLRFWLLTTRSLIEETIGHVSNRRKRASRPRKERPLKLVSLEDRIVFSATPMVALPIEPGIEPADGQAPESTPPPEENLYAQTDSSDGNESEKNAGTNPQSAAWPSLAVNDDGAVSQTYTQVKKMVLLK